MAINTGPIMTTPRELAGRALLLHQAGRHGEAEAIGRLLLVNHPDHSGFLHFLAVLRSSQNRMAEAVPLYRRALALVPLWTEAWCNLAVAVERLRRPAQATALLRRAVAADPSAAQAYGNLGSLHRACGDRGAALAGFARAAILSPADAAIQTNLGLVLRETLDVQGSIAALTRAVVCAPASSEAHLQRAHSLCERSRFAEAMTAYGRAGRLVPENSEIQGYHLLLKQSLCDWSDYDARCRAVAETIDRGGSVIPLAILAIDITAGQQRRAAERFHDRVSAPLAALPEPPVPRPPASARVGEPLRVAYLSADFHEHATAHLAAGLFERHDRARVTPLAYSYGPDDASPMRRRLEAAFSHFCDIRGTGAGEVARHMRNSGVDILVDLKGCTKQARFDLLAHRLAPVQVAYLGYPGTSGCPHMDYILGDPVVTPPDHQSHYTERLVLLPDSYQVNDRGRPLPDRTPDRAECGLPAASFVFCTFNAPHKISPVLFDLWMRLLRRVPGSVLWLLGGAPEGAANLRREAADRGIGPDRLVFAARKPLAEHLGRYRVADLCVDTLPYNGHTTTSDALWAGCPVVTCLGETFASRVAASLLTAAGLPELVTRTLGEYEELAVALAGDAVRLAGLRRRLEDSRWQSALFDSDRFARHLELAYETMWRLHADGRPPVGFALRRPAAS